MNVRNIYTRIKIQCTLPEMSQSRLFVDAMFSAEARHAFYKYYFDKCYGVPAHSEDDLKVCVQI